MSYHYDFGVLHRPFPKGLRWEYLEIAEQVKRRCRISELQLLPLMVWSTVIQFRLRA